MIQFYVRLVYCNFTKAGKILGVDKVNFTSPEKKHFASQVTMTPFLAIKKKRSVFVKPFLLCQGCPTYYCLLVSATEC